jgi:hypothetical protein
MKTSSGSSCLSAFCGALLWREHDFEGAVLHRYVLVEILFEKRCAHWVKLFDDAHGLSAVVVDALAV